MTDDLDALRLWIANATRDDGARGRAEAMVQRLAARLREAEAERDQQASLAAAARAEKTGLAADLVAARADLKVETERAERLVRNVLPGAIADRLAAGENRIADYVPDASILLAEIADLEPLAPRTPPAATVDLLDTVFDLFDQRVADHGLERLRTIGATYEVVAGLPVGHDDHLTALADLALDLRMAVARLRTRTGEPIAVRFALHVGAMMGGIIGRRRFTYDVLGSTVEIGGRLLQNGVVGRIVTSGAVYNRLAATFAFERKGRLPLRGGRPLDTFFLTGRRG